MSPVEIHLKNRLRILRAERAWSQGELSVRLGVSRQAINAIETEKHDPSLELAFKIAYLFRLPLEEIFDPGTIALPDAGPELAPPTA